MKKNTIYLAYKKANLSIVSEISNNKFGYFSLLIEPILLILTYYFVFGVLVSDGKDEFYVYYLISGIIPWIWIQKTVSRTAMTLVKNKNIILQMKIDKLYFILVEVFQELIKFTIPLIILLFIFSYYGYYNSSWALLIVIIPVIAINVFAISTILSVLVVFLRDVQLIIPSCMRILMYLSGVVYNIDNLPNEFKYIFELNPFYQMISLFRDAIMYPHNVSIERVAGLFIFGCGTLLIGRFLINKYNNEITLEVIK
ncbi:MAG: ABC transporter permease [Moritella sp.]|uniref:ABC transporter permease n=1 Tax=Moritella sp. TaxID=78556 RepID=UPI0025D906B1|nr:ABC transporter permease [Moritella sp.]NQZ94175.1 ABC transporter permease [Moritella sp.]